MQLDFSRSVWSISSVTNIGQSSFHLFHFFTFMAFYDSHLGSEFRPKSQREICFFPPIFSSKTTNLIHCRKDFFGIWSWFFIYLESSLQFMQLFLLRMQDLALNFSKFSLGHVQKPHRQVAHHWCCVLFV